MASSECAQRPLSDSGSVQIESRRELRIKSDNRVMQFAFRRARLVGRQRGVVAIERRAIGAHILNVLAHVAKDMRMILWW